MSAKRQRKGPPPRPQKPRHATKTEFNPTVNPKLEPILAGIGIPEQKPFVADPFQSEAIATLERADVVVSAPTGSGKTWIAEQAMAKAFAQGQRTWYASPLKALSNSKYHEFGEKFGTENVGILTGDRKENPNAPLIVGTTEILRNQLYDAMYRGEDLDVGLVVLDEAHYLGDPDRGVVWEEVIIYLPVRVRLLLLSATVANARQIAAWLSSVRGETCETVISNERPVPMMPLFMFPDGEISPLKSSKGMFPKVEHFVESDEGARLTRHPVNSLPPFGRVLSALEHTNLLPAIFFLKSRAECDQAITMVVPGNGEQDAAQRVKLNRLLDGFVAEYPFLAGHPHMHALRNLQVAAHHAGHLPHWKLVIEKLMQAGLLRAIFSTSTVAAGVNFPARTVVITQSDRFNGREFVDLTATDLLQMTGRAGRRGMDKIGFSLVVPGPWQDVRLMAGLFTAEPEPIESQLSINFSMVLNLLLSQRPAEVKQMLGLSLATFQRLERKGGGEDPGRYQRVNRKAGLALAGSDCPGAEEALVRRRRRRQLENLVSRYHGELALQNEAAGLSGALTRGRVFSDMYGELAAVLRQESHGETAGVLSIGLTPDKRLTRGRPRLDFIPLDEITGVFKQQLKLPQTGGGRALANAVLNQTGGADPEPMSGPEIEALGKRHQESIKERLTDLQEELAEMPCQNCPMVEACGAEGGDLRKVLDQAESALAPVREESHVFWYDFVRHLEFLRAEGFVDAAGRLTADGKWAANLRLDHPVLIAEAIRTQALPAGDPVLLAGLLALFVDDREREAEAQALPRRLMEGVRGLRWALDPMLERLKQWGFHAPPMPRQASAAVFAWCQLVDFDEAVAIYGLDDGDLAALIYRTADNLRQVISLAETHPQLVETAREAVELLLRPPVVLPV